MQLIINADDFGLTEGVNHGIVQAFQKGIVRSTTLMMGMPATEQAIALSMENPELKVGVHLRLTTGQPMASEVPSLLGNDGQLQKQSLFWENQGMNTEEIERELRAQIEQFISYDVPLSHLDGHHHCHSHPQVAPIASKLAQEYGVPIRPCGQTAQFNGKSLMFSDRFYGDSLSTHGLLNIIEDYKGQTQVLELMAHPAIVDKALEQVSGYSDARAQELKILTDPTLPDLLASMGIAVTDYSCLMKN